MELWLSIVGFLVVIGIIVSIMTKKLSTMVALSVIPLIGAILVGQFTSIPGSARWPSTASCSCSPSSSSAP